MSTYSTTLRLELIGNGEQDGTWGDTTNLNLGSLLEAAITGVETISFLDANVTLTANNGLPDQARNAVLVLAGANTAPRDLITPSVEKVYVITNATGNTVNIKTSGGSPVSMFNGCTQMWYCNGTDYFPITQPLTDWTGTGRTVLQASPALTGTPTAPTASPGTNTTQIATTAFVGAAVTAATGALGTMSTQNANAVAITGGTINATTIGASNAAAATFTTATATTLALGGGWTVTESGGTLLFRSSGTNRMRLDTSGNLTVTGNVTAYGTL